MYVCTYVIKKYFNEASVELDELEISVPIIKIMNGGLTIKQRLTSHVHQNQKWKPLIDQSSFIIVKKM